MTPIDERLEEKTEDRVEKGHTIGHRGRLTHLPSLVPFRHGVGVFLDAHGQIEADYTARRAAYDLRKLRAKALISKPGRSRRYAVPPAGARTISAPLTLRDQVIVPILAVFAAHASDLGLDLDSHGSPLREALNRPRFSGDSAAWIWAAAIASH